jgi:hypothetical protein
MGPTDLEAASGRDLLVIGAADNHSLVDRWAPKLPLRFVNGRPVARVLPRSKFDAILTWLEGRYVVGEAERAEEIAGQDPDLAAAMAIESPLDTGREAVILSASTSADMPAMRDLQGSAVAKAYEADLLLASRGSLWLFKLGPSYTVGKLDDWRRFLLFMAQHWIALFPFALLGTVIMAAVLRASLRQRVKTRLAQVDAAEDA